MEKLLQNADATPAELPKYAHVSTSRRLRVTIIVASATCPRHTGGGGKTENRLPLNVMIYFAK